MKKIRIIQIVELVVLVCIAIGLISFLSNISKKSISENNTDRHYFNFTLASEKSSILKVLKEEHVDMSDIQEIELNFSSSDIDVSITDDSTISIIESATVKLEEDELFTLINQNGKLVVTAGRKRRQSVLFGFGFTQRKVELLLPKKYAGDLNLTTSSGDIRIFSDLDLKNISVNQASGDLKTDYALTVQSFKAQLASGDIKVKYLECKDYALKTASGDIAISFLKGSGDIATMSGDITIKELEAVIYTIQSASGDINLKKIQGSGEVRTASGDIDASYLSILEYSRLTAASGDIDIELAEDISFEMEAKCISGEIRGNVAMDYKNKKASQATAVIGEAPYAKLTISTASGDVRVHQN